MMCVHVCMRACGRDPQEKEALQYVGIMQHGNILGLVYSYTGSK